MRFRAPFFFSPPCRSLAQLLGAFLDLAMLHQWMSIAGRFLDPVFFGVEVKTSKWGVPEIGVPHFIIHRWIFHDKPIFFWGYPHVRKRLNALQQMSSPTNVSFFLRLSCFKHVLLHILFQKTGASFPSVVATAPLFSHGTQKSKHHDYHAITGFCRKMILQIHPNTMFGIPC